jgi:hypothetical protein
VRLEIEARLLAVSVTSATLGSRTLDPLTTVRESTLLLAPALE